MAASSNSMWQLIRQSDGMTYFVLFVLLAMSIFTWTVLFYKMLVWRVKKRQLAEVAAEIKHVQAIDELLILTSRHADTVPGFFIARILSYLKALLSRSGDKVGLHDREWDLFEYTTGQTVDEIVYKESSLIPLVGACMTISPLLGLFGTVWGLVQSFADISRQQSADIATVAPGIAMALITTVAGLVVAIPAAFIYYYLQIQLRSIENKLVSIADRCLFIVQRLG